MKTLIISRLPFLSTKRTLPLLVLLLLFTNQLYAAKTPNILILNSYHDGYHGTDDIIRGFRQVISERFAEIDIKVEYLDSKLNSGEEYHTTLQRLLTLKYQDKSFDLVVASDDYAYNFVEKHHEELFPQTPVVFCGTNAFDETRLEGRPQFVGVDERPSFQESIELIFNLRPETEKIIVIHDGSITGKHNSQAFRSAADRFSQRADFIYWVEQSLEELQEQIRGLSPETALFYFSSYVKSNSGKVFGSSEALEILAAGSPVPIYGGWEFSLTRGILGGKLINLSEHGALAAKIAADILQGKSPEPMARLFPSPNSYMFDDAQLQRFSIGDAQLPAGSIIVNRPPSFYQQYKTAIFASLSSFLGLLVLGSFASIYSSRNRLRASYREQLITEGRLRRSEQELKHALSEVKTLQGIISICSYCKEIRDDAGTWSRLEEYIETHSDAQFSHGICDKCMADRFGKYLQK